MTTDWKIEDFENNQKENLTQFDYEESDEQESGDYDCPKCGKTYDDADFDFQICYFCGHNNNY